MRLSFALALFVAGIAPSQTYVVDAAGGAGANFTSIAAAATAVPDGALLLVRAGTYAPFAINNKGLTVLADPGVGVQGSIQIINTTATQAVVLRNLEMIGAFIDCLSCAGPVLLDQIRFVPTTGALLWVRQCSQVMATSSVFRGGGLQPAVFVISSQLAFINSRADVTGFSYAGGIWVNQSGSRVQVVSSVVQTMIGAAIAVDVGNDVRLLGSTTVTAPPGPNNYSISSYLSTVRCASTVSLTGAVQVSSMVTVDDESLSGTGGALGGSVSATLNGANGNIALLVLGVTGPPLPVPGIIDSWWLDPAVSASVALAIQNGPLTATVAIPPTPTLQGQLFGFQGLFLTPTGLSVSNPHRFVIR
jgi:hypothetical protein